MSRGTANVSGDSQQYSVCSRRERLKNLSSGTFNLDCKPLVPRERIRPIAAAASAPGGVAISHEFPVNSHVEYLSGTLNQWISARVLSHNSDGTYNLDCKPLVAAERVRGAGAGKDKPRVLDDVLLEEGGTVGGRW